MRCAPVVVASALKSELPVTVSVPCVEMLPAEVVVALPLTLKRPVMRWAPVVVALLVTERSADAVTLPVTVSVPCVEMLPAGVVVALPLTVKAEVTASALEVVALPVMVMLSPMASPRVTAPFAVMAPVKVLAPVTVKVPCVAMLPLEPVVVALPPTTRIEVT